MSNEKTDQPTQGAININPSWRDDQARHEALGHAMGYANAKLAAGYLVDCEEVVGDAEAFRKFLVGGGA